MDGSGVTEQRVLAAVDSLGRTFGAAIDASSALRALGFHVGADVRFYGLEVATDTTCASGAVVGLGVRIGPAVTLRENSIVRSGASLSADVVLGPAAVVGENATLENIQIGANSQIEPGVVCLGHGKGRIVVGRESYIGLLNVIDWSGGVTIGDHVHVAGPTTAIWTHSSVLQALSGLPLADKSLISTGAVSIEDRVYVGGNCTIYPGVQIGAGSVVLPNSAVSASIPAGSLAGGVPAKVLGPAPVSRGSDD